MPPPSKKARLAQSQRPPGTRYFNNGLLDDIENIRIDPNFIPFIAEDVDAPDSEDESGGAMRSFNIADDEENPLSRDTSADSDSDSEEAEAEWCADREEKAVCEAVKLASKFWKKALDKRPRAGKPPPPLKARATYTGVSKSSKYAKNALNRKAAEGCSRISNFFRPKAPSPVPHSVFNSEPESSACNLSSERITTDTSEYIQDHVYQISETRLLAIHRPASLPLCSQALHQKHLQ
ncbi:hypothetical protein BDY19DRAFT_586862 [Irpex rosettiformis]|uniref:Uncharacterized protein n=1 Tax=Irpex rosettiformis TaxID=378272 RepID=A0ACB8UD05_9APHY|nr:hypothetical protein BDY19DRAFT_586862 [Irpex rosettiformis]